MPHGLNTDQLIPRTIASGVGISWSELAEPVVSPASRAIGARRRIGQVMVAGGTRRNSLRHYDDVPASLVDVFHIYRDVIGHISDSDFGGEWFCYPVVCIDKLDC